MNPYELDSLMEEEGGTMPPSLLDEKLRSVSEASYNKLNKFSPTAQPQGLAPSQSFEDMFASIRNDPNGVFGLGNQETALSPSESLLGSPQTPSQGQTLPEVPTQQADPFSQLLQAKLPAQKPTAVTAEAYASDPGVYDSDPNKEYRHKQAYANTYNLHPSEVTRDDLLAVGSQQAELPGEARQAAISTPEGNANLFGSNNAQQLRKHLWDPNTAKEIALKQPRDSGVQLTDIAGRAITTGISGIANGIAETVMLLDPTKLIFDQGLATKINTEFGFTQGVAKLNEAAKNKLISPQDLYADKKMFERLQLKSAVNEKNRAKLIKQGYSPEYATASVVISDIGDALSELVREPSRAVGLVGDAIPSVITAAIAGRVIFNKVMKLLPTNPGAARAAAEAAGISIGALQEASSLSAENRNKVLNTSPEDLKKSSQYVSYRAQGMSHEDAKTAVADDVGTIAFGSQFLISAVSSKLTGAGKFESGLLLPKAGTKFQQDLAERSLRGLSKTARGVVAETPQEGIESASAPLLSNVLGNQYLGESTPVSRGVGTQAGLGMAAGGLMGGGLAGTAALPGVASQRLSGPNVNRNSEAIPKTPQAQAINQSITNASREVDLPPIGEAYLRVIAEVESSWGTNNVGQTIGTEVSGDPAQRGKKALGPFQFMPETAAKYGIDPMNPQQAALAAAKMMQENANAIKKVMPGISDDEAYLRAAVAHHSGLSNVLGGTAGTESATSQQDYGTNDVTFRDPAQQQGMRPETLQALSSIGIPLTINSGHRTEEYNASIGGAKSSQHIQGTAADISMEGMDPTQRVELVQRLRNKGFTYFMTYDNSGHLHADMREGPTKFNHKSGMDNAPDWLKQAQAQVGTGSQSTGTMPNLSPNGQKYLTDMKSRVSKYFGSRGFEGITRKDRARGVVSREEMETIGKDDEDTANGMPGLPEDKKDTPKTFDFYRQQPKEYFRDNPREFARFKEAYRNKADELEPLVQPLTEDSPEFAALTKDFFDATARIKETDEFLRSDVVTSILDRLDSNEVLSVTPSQKYGTPNDSGSINLSSTVSNYELSSLVEAAKSGVLKEEDYKKIAAANPNNLPEPIKNILTQYTPNIEKARELYKTAKAISPEMAKVALQKFSGTSKGNEGFIYHQQKIMDGMIQNIAQGTLIGQSKNALMSFDNFVGTQQKKLKALKNRDTSKYSEDDLDNHNALLAQVQKEQLFLKDVLEENLLAYENLREIVNKRRAEILPSVPNDKKEFYGELDPYDSQVVRTQLSRGVATSSKPESSPKEETTPKPVPNVSSEYYAKAKKVASYSTSNKTIDNLKTALNNINNVLKNSQFKDLTDEQKTFLQKKHTEVSEALKKLSETAVKPPQKPSKPEVVPTPRVEPQKPSRAPTQPSETAPEEPVQEEARKLLAKYPGIRPWESAGEFTERVNKTNIERTWETFPNIKFIFVDKITEDGVGHYLLQLIKKPGQFAIAKGYSANTVIVQKNITKEEILKYLEGHLDTGPTAKQKALVNEYMKKEMGIDLVSLIQEMDNTTVRKFIIAHEASHLINKDIEKKFGTKQIIAEKYGKKDLDNPYLADDRIQIEVRANKEALEKLNLLPTTQQQPTATKEVKPESIPKVKVITESPTINETSNVRVRIDPKVARVVLVDAYRTFLDCK